MNIKHVGVTIQTATELKKGKQVYLNRTQVREKKRLGKTKCGKRWEEIQDTVCFNDIYTKTLLLAGVNSLTLEKLQQTKILHASISTK